MKLLKMNLESEMSEKLAFVETLINSIIDNRNMPKVQVEREISPILDIFMPDILNQLIR